MSPQCKFIFVETKIHQNLPSIEENKMSKPQKKSPKPTWWCGGSCYCNACYEANYFPTEPDTMNEKSIANLQFARYAKHTEHFANAE